MRQDAEEDEPGEEGGKVGSQEASRHARNLDSTQDTQRWKRLGVALCTRSHPWRI